MTRCKILTLLLSGLLAVALLGGGLARTRQHETRQGRSPFEPLGRKTIAGEVMSVDPEKRTVMVRILENGKQPRDLLFALEDRTVLKKLRTRISGGDLSPGHLVKVTYREHGGRLVARRVEVTGKAVHPSMP